MVTATALTILTRILNYLLITKLVTEENRSTIPVVDNSRQFTEHRSLIIANNSADSTYQQFYSAIAANSSNDVSWDRISVHGWAVGYTRQNMFVCCVRHQSRVVMKYRNVQTQPWVGYGNATIVAWQYRCNTHRDNAQDPPSEVAILPPRSNCDATYNGRYVKVEFSMKRPRKVAIFAKVLYSEINADDLLAWFEIHIALGVDTVLAHFTDTVNENATRVLNYYKQRGILELYHYPLPGKVEVMNNDTPQCWNFKGVSAFDGAERLTGYEYIISMDLDEYLIPARTEKLISVFDRLVEANPDAAGFVFQTYLHIKSWVPAMDSIFTVARLINRSEPTMDRVKHVTIPTKIRPGGIRPHSFLPELGYKAYNASIEDIAIHHYRNCRATWAVEQTDLTCDSLRKIPDDGVYKLLKSVELKIYEIKKLLDV